MRIRQDLLKKPAALPETATISAEKVLPLPSDGGYFVSLWFRTGESRAVPYGLIESLRYCPASGIELRSANALIRLAGKELGALYRDLLTRQVAEIREAESNEAALFFEAEAAGQVHRIEWEELRA